MTNATYEALGLHTEGVMAVTKRVCLDPAGQPKEAELDAGDTKELDDFLNRFVNKNALESTT